MSSLECSESAAAHPAALPCLLPVCVAAVTFVLFGLLPIDMQYALMPSYVTQERLIQALYFPDSPAEYARFRSSQTSAITETAVAGTSPAECID